MQVPCFRSLRCPGGLDLLPAAGLPVVLTDYIAWEATRSGSETAEAIGAWIAGHPDEVSVVETEPGQSRIAREKLALRHRRDAFRVVHALKMGNGVWVIHAFRKE
nr:hypothetical protein [uncultured Rhodopila sp.]